jgi:hypothetical protein
MKTIAASFGVGLLTLAALLLWPIQVCRAQIIVGGATSQSAAPLASVPATGTFFSATQNMPPWPTDWLPQLPVYVQDAANNIFIVDDRGWDYSASGNAMFSAIAQPGGMGAMEMDGPPSPGGTNSGSGSGGATAMALANYTTNDLYLTNFSVAHRVASMVIHPPWYITNGVYDLFYTTNLAPPVSWKFVLRTTPGQTNLLVNNATGPQGFYELGADTSAGTDFWLAFPGVYYYHYEAALTLYISSPVGASGTVSIQSLGFNQPFSVAPGNVTNISLPGNAMLGLAAGLTTNGIHVTSTQPVSVYAGCFVAENWAAAFAAYPTSSLGTNYCAMGRAGGVYGHYSQIVILATTNDTTVTITPSPNAQLSNSETNYFTEILQQGETYQLQSDNDVGDLTGTVVTSDSPIAVFGGAELGVVNSLDDNILSQEQLPTSDWGFQALALPFAGRSGGDDYRVLALNNGTAIWTNGIEVTTLQAGQFYDTIINGPVQFQGSNPIQVAHFANGERYDNPPNFYGNDTEILLPATAQFSTSYTVYSLPLATNYLNIILTNGAVTTLDGTNLNLLATNFVSIGSSGYSGAQIPVLPGAHTITSSQPVEVEVYGFGYWEAYGYVGGALNLR